MFRKPFHKTLIDKPGKAQRLAGTCASVSVTMLPVQKMRYQFISLTLLLVFLLTGRIMAQQPLATGSAPNAALITLAAGAEPDTVTITGASGAVFTRAQVTIRNLLTGETTQTRADTEGGFTAALRGTEFSPYQINPAGDIPTGLPAAGGDLPGGPGIIIQKYLPTTFGSPRTPFAAGGQLSHGAAIWLAEGDIEKTRYAPGDTLQLTMDIRMIVPDADATLPLQMRGQLSMTQINRSDGFPVSSGEDYGNGWSSILTKSGLPVENIQSEILLGESVPVAAVRDGDVLIFTLQFAVVLPADLPAGMYVPVFSGLAQVANSEPFDWYDNIVFSTTGTGDGGSSRTRLPLVLTVGAAAPPGMLWTLFNDTPGEAGAVPAAASLFNSAALSNRVRFPSATMIMPPGNYPVEPYLPMLLPNRYDKTAAPLIPLVLPGGEVTITITRPDARVDRSATLPFQQMTLSSDAVDERTRHGVNTPMNQVRLSTLDALFSNYPFDAYGIYDISLNGAINDASGNRYDVSSAYRVLVAEVTDISPAVLPGTPFEEGDVFQPGVQIVPGMPAEVSVTLRFFPLGGLQPVTSTFNGRASRNGYFTSPTTYRFEAAGEYVVDYEIRYTDGSGRLWAASLRGAGVVAGADSGIIAHGRRGIDGYTRTRQAWFDTAVYPVDAPFVDFYPNYPYYSGDVVYLPDGSDSGIRPIMQVQDSYGQYTQYLQENYAGYISPEGDLNRLITEDALPVIYAPDTYAYISAVRPDVSVRQYVQGNADGAIPVRFDNDDVLNNQPGAGAQGNQPGDYIFLFGGVVTPEDTAIYASMAVITSADETAKVLPPFSAPLFTVDDEPVSMFLLPTGTRPGDVLMMGNTLSIVGQSAPTLPLEVKVRVTAPSGVAREFSGTASAAGYFYHPEGDFAVNEPGAWSIEITTSYSGAISTGMLEAPYPTATGRYTVYVTGDETLSLTSNQPDEADITPGNAIPFVLDVPAGWTQVQAFYTVRTAGQVLDEGTLTPSGGRVTYSYSPATLGRDFLNLETRGAGASGIDVVLVTFAIAGVDGGGQSAMQTKTYTLMTDRMIVVR